MFARVLTPNPKKASPWFRRRQRARLFSVLDARIKLNKGQNSVKNPTEIRILESLCDIFFKVRKEIIMSLF